MPTDPQDPQLQLQKLFKINMWLGIAALVLLILLIASAIAPYIHFGTTGDTDKLLDKLNEMDKSIQANATGKLTAQHFDKELKAFKCEVRKLTPAASAKSNEDTAKMMQAIDELKTTTKSIRDQGLTAKQLEEALKQELIQLRPDESQLKASNMAKMLQAIDELTGTIQTSLADEMTPKQHKEILKLLERKLRTLRKLFQ